MSISKEDLAITNPYFMYSKVLEKIDTVDGCSKAVKKSVKELWDSVKEDDSDMMNMVLNDIKRQCNSFEFAIRSLDDFIDDYKLNVEDSEKILEDVNK